MRKPDRVWIRLYGNALAGSGRKTDAPTGARREYWHCTFDQHLGEWAYVLWQQEGSPEGDRMIAGIGLSIFQAQ
jgi:hypothetical protein